MRTLVYPDGEVVTSTYSANRGLPRAITGTLAGQFTNYGYVNHTANNVLGQIMAQTYGNGVNTAYAYFANNYRLQQIQVGALFDLRYTYDAVGNVTGMTDIVNSSQVLTYTYDALDRLTGAVTSPWGSGQYSDTFGYDAIGNFAYKSDIGTYTYGDSAHKHAVTSVTNGWTYQYDANGNMTYRLKSTRPVTFNQQFDVDNRLVAITNTQGNPQVATVARYYYDGVCHV